MMPRRNRNAHAPRIDADELAAQADQLTAELAVRNPGTVVLIDEIQFYRLGGIPGTGKSNLLREYMTQFIHEHPGCQLTITDEKAVTRYAS